MVKRIPKQLKCEIEAALILPRFHCQLQAIDKEFTLSEIICMTCKPIEYMIIETYLMSLSTHVSTIK